MAQYDILLVQNTTASGVEFSEKTINIAKGGLLSADASQTPTVLAAGTNGYHLVRDDGETTGLKWVAIESGHTQGTDSGTTGDTFTINSDSTVGKLILSASATSGENHSMTITNASMASDVIITLPATTGTVALTSQLHTQNTDVGTSGSTFDIDVDGGASGVRLKANSGVLELRNIADNAYADLTVKDLTVQGTTTTINSTTLTVDDKNIELGSVDSPSDTTADGGGITLKGTTDKTIIWDNANDNWTFNQNVNVSASQVYKINNTEVLSATQVLGVTLGTMAAATQSDFVPKSLYDANTVLYATSDNTPAALTVGTSTFVGRSGGAISALSASEARAILNVADGATANAKATSAELNTGTDDIKFATAYAISGSQYVKGPASATNERILVFDGTAGNRAKEGTKTISDLMNTWVAAPANKTASGTAGQQAYDTNYYYVCTATNVWKRYALATNWT